MHNLVLGAARFESRTHVIDMEPGDGKGVGILKGGCHVTAGLVLFPFHECPLV